MTDVTVNRSVAPNIALLTEELNALSLGQYTLVYPSSYPGDVIAKYDNTLSGPDQTSVTNTITNHDETANTTEQNREDQDVIDLDSIRSDYDAAAGWETLTDAQRTTCIQEMRRCILRIARKEPI